MESERAGDGGTYLWQFRDEFLVRCPRCERMARVGQSSEGGVRLTCAHCGLSRANSPGAKGSSGPVCAYLHGRCGTCGRPAARQPRRLRHPPAKETAVSRCAGCGAQTRLPVRWWPLGTPEGLDPVFGLPLWLRTACRGHLLWAYNARHLAFLERWIGATLRRREPNRNGSLPSRLPGWMTRGRSRDDVLDCIRRLRGLLAE